MSTSCTPHSWVTMGHDDATLVDLLTRLHIALEIAFSQSIYTDEINP